MDDKTLRRIAVTISTTGPYVLSSGVVRQKNPPRDVLKMRKATLMAMVASGHLEIVDHHVRLTELGRGIVPTRQDQRLRSANYAERMRDRGCVRKTLWVHPDDLQRFDDFAATLRGPSE